MIRMDDPRKLDHFAADYRQLHEQSITASGETVEYSADFKLDCVKRLGVTSQEPGSRLRLWNRKPHTGRFARRPFAQ